jgi:hypothetical protein
MKVSFQTKSLLEGRQCNFISRRSLLALIAGFHKVQVFSTSNRPRYGCLRLFTPSRREIDAIILVQKAAVYAGFAFGL